MFYLFRVLKGGWFFLRSVSSYSVFKLEVKRLVDIVVKVFIVIVSGEFSIFCFIVSY